MRRRSRVVVGLHCDRDLSHNFRHGIIGQPPEETMALARLATSAAAAALLLVSGATIACAQTPEQFYRGRQLTMVVFSGAGSTYDIYARLLVRHLGNHIPGKPTLVVQNMLGAGGLQG